MTDTGWRAAVDEQLSLLNFLRSQMGKRFIYGFADRDERDAALLTRALDVSLRTAEPVYMSPDAFTLVDSARRSFQPEPILATDLFIPAGFLLLPAPLAFHDVHDKLVTIRAVSWMRHPVSYAGGRADGIHVANWARAGDPTDYDDGLGFKLPYDLTLLAFHPMALGKLPPSDDSTREWWAALQTIWRLAAQIVPAVERPERAARRNAKRAGLVEHVHVVRLPRHQPPSGEPGSGAAINYSHRFVVRGHWRNQWYPSIRAHRQVWISPYVKGPDDRPLVVKERAFELGGPQLREQEAEDGAER